jgi:hypothetical protein
MLITVSIRELISGLLTEVVKLKKDVRLREAIRQSESGASAAGRENENREE